MTDVHTRQQQSYPDSYRDAADKRQKHEPEMLVRTFLHAKGYHNEIL